MLTIGYDFRLIRSVNSELIQEDVRSINLADKLATTDSGTYSYDSITSNNVLIQSTREYDLNGSLIYHGDKLSDGAGKVYEVMYYFGGFKLVDEVGTGKDLDNNAWSMTKVGNVFLESVEVDSVSAMKAFEESKSRREEI